jgi:hypothetical protein
MTSVAASSQERVLQIPELLETIASHMDGRDLLACVRASAFWNSLLIPILWNTIDDSLFAWPKILDRVDKPLSRHSEDWLKRIFKKYGKYIRHLTIRWRTLIDIAYLDRACTNLLSIKIMDIKEYHTYTEKSIVSQLKYRVHPSYLSRRYPYEWHSRAVTGPVLIPELKGVFSPTAILLKTEERQKRDWMTQQYFWLLLRQNQGLQSISLHCHLHFLSEITSLEFVYDTLAMLPNLATLENYLYRLDLTILLKRVPSLRNYTSESVPPMTVTSSDGSLWNLKRLKIELPAASNRVDQMLRCLPGLRSLCVWSFHDTKYRKASPSLQPPMQPSTEEAVATSTKPFSKTFPLKSLTFENHVFKDQAQTNTVFACFPDLTKLYCCNLTPEVGSAAAQFCPHLDQVCQVTDGESIYHGYYPTNKIFHYTSPMVNSQGPIFRSCRFLKVFDAIQHKFEAEYISNVAWVCEGLEVFRCQILGLKRLNMSEHSVLSYIIESGLREEEYSDEERLVLENVRKCQDLHEGVYDQLSKLSQLRVLDLGYEYRSIRFYRKHYTVGGNEYRDYGGVIRDTLQLSLASGLDRLSTLKNLQVFGFEGVDHEMDLPELEWIAEHWPKLRIMRGLQKDDSLAYIRPDKFRRELRKAMQSLRPDIRHESGKKGPK